MYTSLRPMSTSQVLDRTFFLYRKNFALFAGIAVVTPALHLVAQLIQLAIFGMPVAPDFAGNDAGRTAQTYFLRVAVSAVIGLVVYAVGYAITSGATVRAVSMLHLGRTTSIKECYENVLPIWGRLLGLVGRILIKATGPILLCYGLLIGLVIAMFGTGRGGKNPGAVIGLGVMMLFILVGLLAAFVWAAITYCRYALAVPACTIEGLPVKYSLIRSRFLTKDNLGRVFAVYFLAGVITVVIKTLLQSPIYVSNGFSFRTGLHITAGWLAWIYASEFIGSLFAGPIAAIAMALVYYDERIRKEAFDLQLMMEAMEPASANREAPTQSATGAI
jgi:hypothetical protein